MNGTFWPEDLLPLDVPTARILLFGYNSNVTFNIASGSLRDNATSLLESLRNVRTRSVRPYSANSNFLTRLMSHYRIR